MTHTPSSDAFALCLLRGRRSLVAAYPGRFPHLAAAGDQDAATLALARRRTFHADYQSALRRWRSGDRDVLFPFGTWQIARLHNARVAPGPAG